MTEVMYLHVSTVSGYGRVRHHRVSLPRIYELLADPHSRYLPRDEPVQPASVTTDEARRRRPE